MILIKLQSNCIENALLHRCSPVNLLHIWRTPFLKNNSGGTLVNIVGHFCFKIMNSGRLSLREKFPNTELFLVRIFPYSDWIRTRNSSVFGRSVWHVKLVVNCMIQSKSYSSNYRWIQRISYFVFSKSTIEALEKVNNKDTRTTSTTRSNFLLGHENAISISNLLPKYPWFFVISSNLKGATKL